MHLRFASFLAMVTVSFSASATQAQQCSAQAVSQARKLLAFHFDDSGPISIEKQVRELPPIPNPANAKQKFTVLEVWGHVYKGQYRMRFIYARMRQDCILMGQEIVEYAKL